MTAKPIDEALRALTALYLEVDQKIADDVNTKVRAALAAVRQEERERCKAIADQVAANWRSHEHCCMYATIASQIAAAIDKEQYARDIGALKSLNPLTIDVHIFTGLDKDLLTPEQVSEVEQEMNTLVEKFEREVGELLEQLNRILSR